MCTLVSKKAIIEVGAPHTSSRATQHGQRFEALFFLFEQTIDQVGLPFDATRPHELPEPIAGELDQLGWLHECTDTR